MVDVYLDSDSLTVLGGPSSITVEVDHGVQGDRGSIILFGYGEPEAQSTFTETPQIYDLYINQQTTSANAGWLYQYVSQPGGNVWVPVAKLTPSIYAQNSIASFTNGEATVNVPISAVVGGTIPAGLSSESFNVQHEIVGHSNIVVSSISLGELYIDPADSNFVLLPITIKALEWVQESGDILPDWDSLIDGDYSVHVLITMV